MATGQVSRPHGVRIINPIAGGGEWTSKKKARAYTKRGHARMVGGKLEFLRHPAGAIVKPIHHGPRLKVVITPEMQRSIDFRNFVGFLPPEVYGYPQAA